MYFHFLTHIESMRDSRRSLLERSFSRMNNGSLRGSIFALTASAIGSGKPLNFNDLRSFNIAKGIQR